MNKDRMNCIDENGSDANKLKNKKKKEVIERTVIP